MKWLIQKIRCSFEMANLVAKIAELTKEIPTIEVTKDADN